MGLILRIVSPEKVEYNGDVERVLVPGDLGQFEILVGHAPIISSLKTGDVVYVNSEGTHTLPITGGFVEVQKNAVNVCVEVLHV